MFPVVTHVRPGNNRGGAVGVLVLCSDDTDSMIHSRGIEERSPLITAPAHHWFEVTMSGKGSLIVE